MDQVGHKAGPGSDLVNVRWFYLFGLNAEMTFLRPSQSVLRDVDEFAASIHSSLRERNLTQIVDVIFVSDHGMTNTSNTRLVYLDDVMGQENVGQIEHEDGRFPVIMTPLPL